MNRYIHITLTLAVATLFTTIPAHAATMPAEQPDTVLKITSPAKLILTESASGTKLELQEQEADENVIATVLTEYSEESSVKTKIREGGLQQWWQERNLLNIDKDFTSDWGISVDGICIGLNKSLNQSPGDGLQWSKSFEISWMSCLNVYYRFRHSRISLGLGFDWRNYRVTTSGKYLVATENKGIGWADYPDKAKGRFSRLKVFSLQLPLLYEWKLPKSSLSFKCGPILNFNTYASLKTAYDDSEGNRIETFTKGISPRRCTVDLFAGISLCKTIGIYVRYSPMKVMDAPGSLNFNPLTLGLGFGI